MREVFRWLSLWDETESIKNIDGLSWDFDIPKLMKKNGKAYEPDWMI
jgi:hypothetical protein